MKNITNSMHIQLPNDNSTGIIKLAWNIKTPETAIFTTQDA